ncbi:predicted protein [Histoplasma capsulatum H143]|uniref:Uncharacterized protein n=1 Tax=Ajellomyces capsulatus (strain H143) TaxID=544712 RepID=C6HKJ3_AJECH|nr:predicted protein [Histoplasma capsulatum H143]
MSHRLHALSSVMTSFSLAIIKDMTRQQRNESDNPRIIKPWLQLSKATTILRSNMLQVGMIDTSQVGTWTVLGANGRLCAAIAFRVKWIGFLNIHNTSRIPYVGTRIPFASSETSGAQDDLRVVWYGGTPDDACGVLGGGEGNHRVTDRYGRCRKNYGYNQVQNTGHNLILSIKHIAQPRGSWE